MALDGIFLSKIKDELIREICFSRVEKVHQPSREELVIHLRGKTGAKKLFLSIRGNSPRIHLTEHAPENPAVPPMFCMLMRKKFCAYSSGIKGGAKLREQIVNSVSVKDYEELFQQFL